VQLLPEGLREDRDTGRSAIIQETYAEDFSCLLRLGRKAKRKERGAKRKTKEFVSHFFLRRFLPAPCFCPLLFIDL
jgi:hypothetical protein